MSDNTPEDAAPERWVIVDPFEAEFEAEVESARARFTYQPPTAETIPKFTAINDAFQTLAEVIVRTCPPSRDRSNALTQLQISRMLASSSIALAGTKGA